MNSLKIAQNFLTRTAYGFSSVQMQLPDDISKDILNWNKKNIPGDILTDEGRENDIHVTVKYGIHITDFTELRNIFVGLKPFEATLGNISLFNTNPNYDVVKIEIESPDLLKMNKKISNIFEVTDTHPVYNPHVTLAFVKKGCGDPYINMDVFSGIKLKLDSVVFSGKDNRRILFKLD